MARTCIGDDMTLSALHFLARIIATNAATSGRFDALAVNHSSTEGAFIALRYPCIFDEMMVDPLPRTIITPTIKIMLHCSCWRKAQRHHPPRQAAAQHIQQGFYYPPHRPFARATYKGR
jgi:hypothetical protein